MEIGQRIKIANTNSIWDNKEGVLENIDGDRCTVFVDFIPKEGKRVRQNFNLDNIQEIGHNDVEQPKEQVVEENISMDFTREAKAEKLAKYLSSNVDDVENIGINLYSIDGDEYLVVTEEEAKQEAEEAIKSIYDDLGLDSFTSSFKEYIFNNCINTAPIYDWMYDSYKSYVDDLEYENDFVFGNRLIEELYNNNFLDDDDFEIDEDDEILYDELKSNINLEDLKEKYAHDLADSQDPMEWLREMYDGKDLERIIVDNDLIDIDSVVEECIKLDSVAHFIATYDGDEHDLGDGLYAYKVQ